MFGYHVTALKSAHACCRVAIQYICTVMQKLVALLDEDLLMTTA